MIALVLYYLAAFGLAYVLGHSRISYPFRMVLGGLAAPDATTITELADRKRAKLDLHWDVKPIVPVVGPILIEMIECSACFGVWIGGVIGWFMPPFVEEITGTRWVSIVVMALSTAASNLILAKHTKLL